MFTYEQVQKWTAMPKLQVEGEGFAQMSPLRDADLIFWEGAGSRVSQTASPMVLESGLR